MNAPTNPQIEIAVLKGQLWQKSNDSVIPQAGCAFFPAKFGGNSVRVEYKYSCEAGNRDEATYEDVALECFWFAGQAFDLESVDAELIKKWQMAAFEHAVSCAEDDAAQDQWERRMEQAAEYAA